jgi:hypothetical protein
LENQDPSERKGGGVKHAFHDSKSQKVGSLLPVEEEKGTFIGFDLKTRDGQPSDATKYKKYFRNFKEGNPQDWIDMMRDLEEIWTQNSMAGGTDRASSVRGLVCGESAVAFESRKGSDKSNQGRTRQPSLECSKRDGLPASGIGNSAILDEQEDV